MRPLATLLLEVLIGLGMGFAMVVALGLPLKWLTFWLVGD